jgi:hypothetical protein
LPRAGPVVQSALHRGEGGGFCSSSVFTCIHTSTSVRKWSHGTELGAARTRSYTSGSATRSRSDRTCQ